MWTLKDAHHFLSFYWGLRERERERERERVKDCEWFILVENEGVIKLSIGPFSSE